MHVYKRATDVSPHGAPMPSVSGCDDWGSQCIRREQVGIGSFPSFDLSTIYQRVRRHHLQVLTRSLMAVVYGPV